MTHVVQIEARERWGVFNGLLMQRWSRLTRDESRFAEGRFQETAWRMQMRNSRTCRRLGMRRG